MSKAILYHGWGVQSNEFVKSEQRGQDLILVLDDEAEDEELFCTGCGSDNVIRKTVVVREIRTLPIGRKRVWLRTSCVKLFCHDCQRAMQLPNRWAAPWSRQTLAFERYALDLLRHTTIKDVAEHLGVSWDTIKDIQKRYLKRRFGRVRLGRMRRIAIDEISIGRGHRYLTVVLDLDRGAVVFVGDGKGAKALEPFWRRLGPNLRRRIQAVAMDMSPAFQAAVIEHLPLAKIVFDRFHVMKLYNDKLSDLRREVQREAETRLKRDVLKGIRWLLLRNEENLNDERKGRRLSDKERLQRALELNAPLATAYYLKEDLRRFWEQKDEKDAREFLEDWVRRANASGIRMLQTMAKTLQGHRSGLLAYYRHPISTAALEGTNTKIRVMQRQAYGFRDQEFFKLKIYAIHESRLALVG